MDATVGCNIDGVTLKADYFKNNSTKVGRNIQIAFLQCTA